MFRIDIYIPETHVEQVADAIFAAGAGKTGNYERCCFVFPGKGRFRPLDGANPFIGAVGSDEEVREVKLEAVFPEDKREAVIRALKLAHPYETPAFQYWKVETE